MLKTCEASIPFDKQEASHSTRYKINPLSHTADTTSEKRSRLELQRSTRKSGMENFDRKALEIYSDDLQHRAQISSINGDQDRFETEGQATSGEHLIGLVVALFHDGFVCRHINKENKSVEGFAQPYDGESSYFLACIDNGIVPEGLPDMIACADYHSSVLAEIHDYRNHRTALCPVSSAFLSPASAMLQAASELQVDCRVWQTLLLPGNRTWPNHAQVFSLLEQPTLMQSMFDFFPDVPPNELETLAVDAKRQLLQVEDVLRSSFSSDSSSPRADSQAFGFSPAEALDTHATNDDNLMESATPPTIQIVTSAPQSLLSPIDCKRRDIQAETSRCKRQIHRKIKRSCEPKLDQKSYQHSGIGNENVCATAFSSIASTALYNQEIEPFKSPQKYYFQPSLRDNCEKKRENSSPTTSFPAKQLCFEKLKGQRQRSDNQVLDRRPVSVKSAHVGRFVRAATRLERDHSRFLHINARKLMQAEDSYVVETEHVAGSMRYLARQLEDLSRPSDVIALACDMEANVAEDEDRDLHVPRWMTTVQQSSIQQSEYSAAFVWADKEPFLDLRRVGRALITDRFTTDTAQLIDEYDPTAGAPHFNAFDNEGNLQYWPTS